jgi:prolyl oligopeptidase
VVANIRGGGEYGEAWHLAGNLTRKQTVFDDFIAAAEHLVQRGYTKPARLAIMGGSNGGLLMGASLVQHPEQSRAVVAMVGIYDVPRHETAFANGPYNRSEYGSVKDPAIARAMLAYSPLHNVKPNTKYPAVLFTTGANDPRVAPWQSRKFAAAVQDASTSGYPVLLLTRMNAGHGIGAPFSQRVGNAALSMTFFATELGLGE